MNNITSLEKQYSQFVKNCCAIIKPIAETLFIDEVTSMGTILENLHKFHIKTAVDDLHEKGGNPHVNDNHQLQSVYRCRLCGYVYDESKEGKPFSSIDHCPKCGAVQLTFEQLH